MRKNSCDRIMVSAFYFQPLIKMRAVFSKEIKNACNLSYNIKNYLKRVTILFKITRFKKIYSSMIIIIDMYT